MVGLWGLGFGAAVGRVLWGFVSTSLSKPFWVPGVRMRLGCRTDIIAPEKEFEEREVDSMPEWQHNIKYKWQINQGFISLLREEIVCHLICTMHDVLRGTEFKRDIYIIHVPKPFHSSIITLCQELWARAVLHTLFGAYDNRLHKISLSLLPKQLAAAMKNLNITSRLYHLYCIASLCQPKVSVSINSSPSFPSIPISYEPSQDSRY